MESAKRSFRVIAAYDAKGNDVLALLKNTRLEIDAKKGRVCQAGARAGSQLFRTQKCQGKKVSLPQNVVVLIQETTRGSTNKKYGYSVEIGPLLLESLPQAAFQTGLYIVGSSRATRIYIDERIFVQSIVVSLLSLSMQYCTLLWEAVYEGKRLSRVFLDRFHSAGQPILVIAKSTPNVDKEEMGEVSLKSDMTI
ncbi:hypothetical protein KFL_011770020 [Klebsormidium nitens]|uniref:Uncharacterized protein n=1 Tax=Klebsormidium nitens TaxID=105231 RepID=A0A1Y1IVY1_KLENI|nr:hypothetical protein KFL_011770020 [Klebsormidium nitens]|eukprot:GAQ92877.1 hypothetical protein KFL_011770020 [Klebsormidium nitens]